ncbi:MAG: transporter [Naasia sp.]|nr:transporter [Naasia sp.]
MGSAYTGKDMQSRPAPFPTLGLLVLAGAIFCSVTGEFLPTGLLPEMAHDLGVSVPQTGLLVSVFAVTVVAATTPLAALTRSVSRKRLVVLVLLVNAGATVFSAVAPTYEVLVGARILAGLAHGLFWAVVGAYAAHLVPKEQLARAIAISGAGATAAFVLGVPVSTALGHLLGWRLSFVGLAVAMVVLAGLVVRALPPVDHGVSLATGEIPLPARRDPSLTPVLLLCVTIVFVLVGQNVFYTYIAPFITGAMGFGPDAVGLLLFVYGGAGVLGLVLAGLVATRHPVSSIAVAAGAVIASMVALAAAPQLQWLSVAAMAAWGVAFGSLPPLLQTRQMHLASERIRDLAAAGMTTAFNVGIGGGSLVGALILDRWGIETLPWVGAGILTVGTVLFLVLSLRENPRKASAASVIV